MNTPRMRTTLKHDVDLIASEIRRLAEDRDRNELSRRRLEAALEEVVRQMTSDPRAEARAARNRFVSEAGVALVRQWQQGDPSSDPPRAPATETWLAEMCEVSKTHMNGVLGRTRECSPRLAAAIERVTGVPALVLLPLDAVAVAS